MPRRTCCAKHKKKQEESVERHVRFDCAIIASAIPADRGDRDSRFYRSFVAGSAAVSILEHENCEDRTKGSCVHGRGRIYNGIHIGRCVGRWWSSSCEDSEAYTGQSRGCVATDSFFSSSMHPSPSSLADRKASRQTLLESVRINRGESQAFATRTFSLSLFAISTRAFDLLPSPCMCVYMSPIPGRFTSFSSRRYLSSYLERGEPIVSRIFLNWEKSEFEGLWWNANESGKSCFAASTLLRKDCYLKSDYLNERSEYLNEKWKRSRFLRDIPDIIFSRLRILTALCAISPTLNYGLFVE